MEPTELQDHGVSEHTGFPNAATDARLSNLDLSKLLVRHPSSTFYMRIAGDSGVDEGIFANDIAVVDRSLSPKKSDLVIWWDGDAFMISRAGKLPNKIIPWGVITYIIHEYRNVRKESRDE